MRFACSLALLVVLALPAAAEPGLAGWWRFDDARGDEVADASGAGGVGDVTGARWVKGRFGTALRFTGRHSYVTLPRPAGIDGSNAVTVEAWVLWEGTGRYPNILTTSNWDPGGLMLFVSGRDSSFRMGRPGSAPWNPGRGWAEVGAPLVRFQTGRWYHLAAVFDRPAVRTYVDGLPVGAAHWDHPVGIAGPLLVGRWGDPEDCHRGLVDEVKVYRRALAPHEVRASYEREASRRGPSPAGEPAYRLVAQKGKPAPPAVALANPSAVLHLDARGRLVGIIDRRSGRNLAVAPFPALVSVRKGGQEYRPVSCSLKGTRLTFRFAQGVAPLVYAVGRRPGWFTFRVASADPDLEEAALLSARVRPAKYVSGMVGMASDDAFAIAVRVLDLRSNVTVTGRPPLLRAVCPRERGIAGAGVALAVSPRGRVRAVLQALLRTEGVTRSALGGPWALDAPANRESYLFSTAGERDVDEWVALAKRSGMGIIHLCGWEAALGHYPPRKDLYPNGLAGLKAVADRIHAAGLKLGLHTLTGCIAPHDAFVTPVPDRRLAADRVFTLAEPVDAADTVLAVNEAPGAMDTTWAYSSRGNVVHVGDELVMFSGYTTEPPFRLTGCTRGAFGTRAAPHAAGAGARRLVAMYGTFYPDPNSTLVDEVADCIARVANLCRADLLYEDGAEGMPGGWYGAARMRAAIYRRIKHPIRIEASEWGYHSWPFHSVIGAWDHPCWGLDRFNDAHCRQIAAFRATDLLPGQLGWWVNLGPSADHDMEMPEEMEYLCAKALGHNAPLSLQGVSPVPQAWNARQDEYLDMIGRYERLRLAGRVPETVRALLRVPGAHFRLARAGAHGWHMTPTDYAAHRAVRLAEGAEAWTVTNRHQPQPLRLRLQALSSAEPYDSPGGVTLAALDRPDEMAPPATAPGVTCTADLSAGGGPALRLAATNVSAEPRGAWARVTRAFPAELDLRKCGAIGVWVHGDGQGEVLNFQINDSPVFYGGVLAEHYVDVDFTGWRYFELPWRERDAARFWDYAWPYSGAVHPVHRTPIMRGHVTALNVYVNGIPRGRTVTCAIGPVRALPVSGSRVVNPVLTVGARRLRFPVTLESGQYLEYESGPSAVVYDERGARIGVVTPEGERPTVASGANRVELSCDRDGAGSVRARVTVVTLGKPVTAVPPAR